MYFGSIFLMVILWYLKNNFILKMGKRLNMIFKVSDKILSDSVLFHRLVSKY